MAIALAVLVLFIVLNGVVLLLVIPAVDEVGGLINELPARFQAVAGRLGLAGNEIGAEELSNGIDKIRNLVSVSVTSVFGILGVVAGGIFAMFTVIALMIYFSAAMPRIMDRAGRLLGDPDRAELLERAFGKVGGYVSGQALLSLTAGAAGYVVFLLMDLPYPALLALITAFFDAIPQVGATLGAIVVAVFALSVSVGVAIGVVVYFMFYQGLENYVLSPRIFARTIELSPVTAFLAVLVGATVGGILGALVALPITAALGEVVKYAWRHRRRPVPEPEERPA